MKPEDQSLLTAYAVGEDLSAEERAHVAQLLRDDPEAAAFVEDAQQLGTLLHDAYGQEPVPGEEPPQAAAAEAPLPFMPSGKRRPENELTAEQRRARVEALKAKAPQLKRTPFLTYQAMITAAAACLVLVGLYYAMNIVQMLMEEPDDSEYVEVDMTKEEDLRKGQIAQIVEQIEADEARRQAEEDRLHEELLAIDLDQEREAAEAAQQDALAVQTTAALPQIEYRPTAPDPRRRLGMDPSTPLASADASSSRPRVPIRPLNGRATESAASPDLQALTSGTTLADTGNAPTKPTVPAEQAARQQAVERAPAVAQAAGSNGNHEVFELNSFAVDTVHPANARQTATLAGARLETRMSDVAAPITVAPTSREAYDSIQEADFVSPLDQPLSTFSVDVDTASYANVRRFLENGELPPAGAVRIEELLNYFNYHDAPPASRDEPLALHTDLAQAPWAPEHYLMRTALKGYEMPWDERPPANLVFLVDVSGSMQSANKLPLVKTGLRELVRKLDERDRVAIVTYAGNERLALPSTTANNTETILHAIDQLGAGGSTNGAGGIRRAYEEARKHLDPAHANRVILCSDGDFNVGMTNRSDLVDLVEQEAESGVYLTILGFGMGNYQDAMLEEISNKGNGNYSYIDNEREARRILVERAAGTLVPIAKDVKIQVEFNPEHVQAYRLIGYENRALEAQDFNDDQKDAGEIGAGHQVIALYEIVPTGVDWQPSGQVDDLKYQAPREAPEAAHSDELLTVKLRYKPAEPKGDTADGFSETSVKREFAVQAPEQVPAMGEASEDFRFSAAVAGFGLKLRDSDTVADWSWSRLRRLASGATAGENEREDFVQLIDEASELKRSAE
ncbi:MAG: uncharacterized protein E1N59_2882 [Puniceicoccaceae bacterium 5H]|nr:MAG: uncharacterized protein E1N59_2882 [Puniceicoccaceae bacterium 5H]